MKTQVKKAKIQEIKKLHDAAKRDADELLRLLNSAKSEAGIKNALVGFFLLAGILGSGDANASAEDFHKFITGMSSIGSGQIKSKSSLSGNTGNFVIEIGPYQVSGNYVGGDNSNIDAKVLVKKSATADEKAAFKPVVDKIAKSLGMPALDILSK